MPQINLYKQLDILHTMPSGMQGFQKGTLNPMRNSIIKEKARLKLIGKKAWNKGLTKKDTPKLEKMGFQKGHPLYIGTKNTCFKTGHIPWNKHLPCREETKQKISIANKKLSLRTCNTCEQEYIPYFKEQRFCNKKCRGEFVGKILSIKNKGKNLRNTHGFKKGQVSLFKGKKRPEQSGMMHPNWKGGITPINFQIRNSLEFQQWRKKVFERDNYTCIKCGIRSAKGQSVILHADHIKPFCKYPELRFDLNNGRTLCIQCHRKTDTYGGRAVYG